jgi:hypothetical protein
MQADMAGLVRRGREEVKMSAHGFDQRPEMGAVGVGAADCVAVERLPDLRMRGGADRPLGAVEIEAALIPGQAAEVEQGTGARLREVGSGSAKFWR